MAGVPALIVGKRAPNIGAAMGDVKSRIVLLDCLVLEIIELDQCVMEGAVGSHKQGSRHENRTLTPCTNKFR
jgi:hypothetical protein